MPTLWRNRRPCFPRPPALLLSAALALTLLGGAALGCRAGGDGALLVYAAASLKDALTPLADDFSEERGVEVRFNWGGSIALAQQLKRGAPGDLFISAGAGPMSDLESEGLLASPPRTLATNRLVVVVPAAAEPSDSPEAALRAAGRVAIGHPELSPAGGYAQEALRGMGLLDELRDRLVYGGDVRTALAYVQSGAAGAGIVYATDSAAAQGVIVAHDVPSHLHPPIVYPAAALMNSERPGAAQEFLAFLLSADARARLLGHGFGHPEGGGQ